jgi:hypothetical protein
MKSVMDVDSLSLNHWGKRVTTRLARLKQRLTVIFKTTEDLPVITSAPVPSTRPIRRILICIMAIDRLGHDYVQRTYLDVRRLRIKETMDSWGFEVKTSMKTTITDASGRLDRPRNLSPTCF